MFLAFCYISSNGKAPQSVASIWLCIGESGDCIDEMVFYWMDYVPKVANFAFVKRYTTIGLQIIVWLGIWLFFAFAIDASWQPAGFYWILSTRLLPFVVFFNLVFYWLLPFYFSGKKRKFLLLSILSFLVFISCSYLLRHHVFRPARLLATVNPSPPFSGQYPFLFLLIPPLFVSLAIFGIAGAMRGFSAFEMKKQAVEAANRRRLEAEIALLKSQINPHFLLNTLNNLYTLSLIQAERTPEAILNLSEMMKYILNECDKPKVALSSDLDFIKNYLSLQQLRLPPNVALQAIFPDTVPIDLQIEPMILIPFIENAFKHGMTTKQPCTIFITVEMINKELSLRVENGLFSSLSAPETTSGMGITNTSKRLAYAYPKTHLLKVEQTNDTYLVELNIQLT